MTLEEILINEKTRVTLNLATFFAVVGFIFVVASWKSGIESRLTIIEEHDHIQTKEIEKATEMYLETQTDLAEIKTDLKWIRATMESN